MTAYRRLFDPPSQDEMAYVPDPLGRLGMGTYEEKQPRFADPGWEAARADWVKGASLPQIVGQDPFSLYQGVGREQPNRRADVFKLQALLHKEGHLDAEATGGPTGYWGGRDDEALRAFQTENGLKVDGYAAPDGETINTMRGFYISAKPKRYAQAGQPKAAVTSQSKMPNMPIAADDWQDPWPDSPIHPDFRRKLFEKESSGAPNHGYDAENDGAYGRYQMRRPALIDAGLMDENSNWTKREIGDKEAFKNNPAAQERAFADFMNGVQDQVRAQKVLSYIGRQIVGAKEAFPVTESGLMAAAHRWGAGFLPTYFQFQKGNGWKSDYSNIPQFVKEKVQKLQSRWPRQYDTETVLRGIETRLREFSTIPYRAAGS